MHAVGVSRRFVAAISLAVLTACTYRGEPDNSVERSLTWFSYIGGEDIRASCRADGVDRYRFVYNGHYRLQIRAYDLVPVHDGADLTVRARGRGGDVSRFSFDKPFGPWDLNRSVVALSNGDAAAIVAALSDAAARAPAAAGQSMQSYDFFWIVTACTGGRFRLFVFRWPQMDIDNLPFVPLLLAHDDSGVPFEKTRRVEGLQEYSFGIAINDAGNGLVGR
jgi:hypothetical protein